MTVHMMKTKDSSEITTKCGLTTSSRKPKFEWTGWHTDVTCDACLPQTFSKEISGQPLLSDHDLLYNRGIKQATGSSPEANQQGEPVMPKVEETEKTAEAPAAEATTKEKKVKAPLPDGWITPVQFCHALNARLGLAEPNLIRPQIVYGWVKNGKDFPQEKNTDGAYIVHAERAHKWYDELQARKAANAAKKAAKPAEAAAATPAAATTSTPS